MTFSEITLNKVILEKKMSYIKIESMQKSDYKDVYNLWMSCKNMGFNNVDDSEAGIGKFLDRNPTSCFIARDTSTDKKEIIGVILAGNDGRRGFIHHMAVGEKYRRRGIATRLLNSALGALKKEGITKVGLWVFGRNEAGNAFWEKQGFTLRPDLNYRNRALVDLQRIDT